MAELISQYVREKLNEAKKRRSLNFDNSKRMKHPLEPIATTIMDIFDNSDSELSDLSLHSSLLNSPISSTAPLEVVEGNKRIDDQKAETTLNLFDNSDLKSSEVSLHSGSLDVPIFPVTPAEDVKGKQMVNDSSESPISRRAEIVMKELHVPFPLISCSTNATVDSDKQGVALQLDLFDNSMRIKHESEPIETTIMDIFDNSDSELSDLSLHSSLLNSPISSTAPLEVVEGNQRIDNQNAETTILSLFDNSDLKSFQVSLQTSLLDSPISTTPLETVEGKQRIDDQKAETDNSALIFSEVLLHTSLQDSPISPVKPIEISRKSEVALNQIPVPLINPHNLMAEEDVTLEQTMNEPKEETITLKLFENSDSELSDHSLHFGLLNSPKCNLAPLEAIQRKKRLEDLKAKVLDIFDTSESELSDTSLHFGLPNSAIYPISSDGKPEMNGSKSTNLRNPPKEIPVPLFPSINPNSYHSKDSLLDADENRLASESDNFSNSERIKHQTEPTIMDVFDCSDSELSDHSLHFGFLNSSISTVATLEALDGMPRLNDTKTAISKTPDSILKEIHVPLINQNSCSSKNDADKKRPASQLDILDSSKRMKHQLGPIETAILDIFDNSDSELSDLSLHSSLLDSPISTVAPLEDVTGKQKIDEQKAQTTTLEMFDDSDSELSDHSVHFGLLDSPMSTTPLETVKGKQRIDDPKAATTMVSIFDSEFKSSEGSFQTILLYSPISPAAPAEVVEGKTRMNDSKLLNSRNAEAVPKDITVPLINAYHSNNSKLDTDKKRPASQFDILNNSKRIKHQSEAIAETTLDIDYSDSELSDHSLHFGLLNCPKFTLTSPEIVAENERLDDSMEATSVLNTANNFDSEFSDFSNHLALPNSSISSETLPALPQETPSMTMTSNSKEPKIALEDINVPLINPFFRNDNLNYSNNAALDADLALIKSLSPISTLLKYQTHVSINRSPQIPWFQSHDNCSACLGRGKLLCCSTCPRVFHFNCVEEGFGPDNEPDDQWKCKSCVCKSKSLKGVAASQYPNKFFKDLLVQMDSINPRVFELPRKIRNRYSNVFSHPLTGEFVSFKDVVIKNCLYMPPRKSIIQANQEPSAIPGDIKEVPKCYRCCKTDFKIAQTSFLNSNTIPDSVNGKLQSQRSELIQCDYCLLYWHLDCLDPPLTCIPPELSKTPPLLDLVDQQRLKMNIWNGSHPLDPRFTSGKEFKEALVKQTADFKSISGKESTEPLVKEHLSPGDLERLYSSPPDSPFLEANKVIQIRKKWMCPCHVDWNVIKSKPKVANPKRIRFKLHYKQEDNSRNISTTDICTTKVTELFKNTPKRISMGKEANNEKIVDRLLETENLTGQLPHKRITVGSLLTKQVSLTERCTQDGNTNLSMLDNSNSELSDLSLYSRLKNAAMCLQKTHKTIHKDPRLNKSKSLNSRKPKTALKDNDFPLISPFFLNKNSYESKIVKLDSDPAVTKFLSTFSAPFKYQCHTPKAMKPNSSHVQTTKRPYHSCVTKTRKPKPPKNWFQSHQACSACLGRGKLLGCSTCPRVFHFNCVEEGFGPDNEPDDQWKCKSCVCKSKSLKGVAASQYPNKFFKDLLVQMDSINPRVFELPRKIRNRYSNVFSHPLTGEFVSFKDVVIKNCLYMPPRKSIIQANQEPSAIPGDIKEVPKCYRCCKTDFKIAQTSFLNSNTIPDSVNGKLQSQRSELIQCDYCLLYWHLDCLDPPLTCIPPELSKTPPLLDLVDQQRLKMNIWNGSHPLDPRFISVNIPKEPLVKEHLTTEDLQRLYSSPPDSPFLEANKFIRIRKKWMCPCHVDWNVMKSKPNVANPKRIRFKLRYKPDNNSTSATTPDILPNKRITVGSLLTEV